MKKMTGAQIVVESLLAEGVDTVFGYPGGAILPTYDALIQNPTLRHILVRHEQGASHMAEGYARVSGKPGVIIVTSGPGATNTITGIADAYMDSTPMVVLAGQVPTSMIGNDAFQEADFTGITRPCTKHNYLVRDVNDLARTIKEAFYIAGTGRPGPVLIDLPKDVQNALAPFKYPDKVELRGYKPTLKGNDRQIEKAMEAIEASERPLFYVGGGVQWSDAAEPLTQLVRGLKIPITTTLMALGVFPSNDPLSLGMLGMHGGYWTNMAVQNCDTLIAVGARFDDRVTGRVSDFAPCAKTIIHIDIDPSSISKNIKVHIPIVGDIKEVVEVMLRKAKSQESLAPRQKLWAEWHEQLMQWKAEKPLPYEQGDPEAPSKPRAIIEELYNLTKGEAVVVTDVGQHQMWTAQMMPFHRPRSWLTSGGLGTMGYGLPAGIGAYFAAPDRPIVVICGDGGIQMNIQELATAVQYKVPIKVIIMNNYYLGMVRQWQEKFYEGRYSHSYMEAMPNFVKLAEAYGAAGFRVEKGKDLAPTLNAAFATPGPVVVDVVIPQSEGVFPMVPAGSAMHEMLFA
ncbi:MAG: biosynthetic-type acetolactate synthase large subunit [Deltaproteobacteria bacterium]|nr:biosynthetic-type acetolactate synthase large subunit [Deltaproteobacteria bacterium]